MLLEKMRSAGGRRLTPQRLAVVDYLEGNTAHPSAEEIFRAVKRRFPTMSFATVYNTLEALKGADAVRELKIDAARRRYDPNTQQHHHLICRACGKIVDVPADYRPALPARLARSFAVDGVHVEFFGTCRPCLNASAAASG
jgi:Fur family peroxide stress response transcriptional regulator